MIYQVAFLSTKIIARTRSTLRQSVSRGKVRINVSNGHIHMTLQLNVIFRFLCCIHIPPSSVISYFLFSCTPS